MVALAQVDSELEGVCPTLIDDLRAMLLELLENVRRHADARTAQIDIAMSDGRVVLRVSDDGSGFESNLGCADGSLDEVLGAGHFGLAGIRERAAARGGCAVISGASQQGTVAEITLPLETPRVGAS